MNVNKISYALPMSYEALGIYDERYRRKVAERRTISPTADDWAEYAYARRLLARLEQSPYFDPGGPEEHASVQQPQPRIEYVYAETKDEYRERCAKITGPPERKAASGLRDLGTEAFERAMKGEKP